jgi:hypothetical protein
MTTPILGMDELAAAQSQPEVPINEALRTLEAFAQIYALDYTATPPGSPGEGDSYLIDAAPTGDWAGHAQDVAFYSGGWHFLTPRPGWRAYVEGLGDHRYEDTDSPASWVLKEEAPVVSPYDVGAMFTGVPGASVVLLRYKFPRDVTFAAGLSPSQGVAGTAATAQTDFDIKRNGVSVGTMRFAAAATAATFIMASQTIFTAGQVLTVVAPGTPDATLSDVGFVLAGTR